MENAIFLEIVKFMHFLIDIFLCAYIFIFSLIYDVYYAGFIFFQTLHWIALKNECIVTYIEKKLIDPDYELGSNIDYLPHNETYHNDITLLIKAILILSTLMIITYRSKGILPKVFAIIAIFLWIHLTYFRKK
jgi:hypothetical protein